VTEVDDEKPIEESNIQDVDNDDDSALSKEELAEI
jgi:hypothetical protein